MESVACVLASVSLMTISLSWERLSVRGVVAETGEVYLARAIVMATGTYLRGRIIIGEHTYSGGPNGQRPARVRAFVRLL